MKNTLRYFFSWSGLFAILLLILASAYGFGQNFRSDGVVQARSGVPAPGALVAVCTQPCTVPSNVSVSTPPSPLAGLCSSASDAVCASPNPVTADGLGNYHFYVKPGKYSVVFYGSGLTASTQTDQIFPCDPSNCSISGNVLVGGTLGVAGVETDTNVNGIRFVNGFPGTGTTQINNAENDLSTTNGLVWTPGTVACGAGQNLALKDNIFVFDFRTCSSAQQQGTNLLFNVKDTNNGAVRDKLMLVDPFTPANVMSASSSSASLYAHTFLEGSLATFATLEAFNGTITVDTGATSSPAVVVGIEGEASVSGTTANTVTDVRGGTFNVGLSGAGNITTASALRAQTVTNTGSGTIASAFSFVAEDQTVGTTSNLAIWSNGKAAFDKPVSFGSFAGGIVPQAAAMVFIRPQSGQLTGGTQTGLQSAPITSSAATSSGIGILARADLGSAFTQGVNEGIEIQTPSLNGGTITEWDGLIIDAAPVAGTKCSIKMAGSTSGTTCINTSAVAGGTAAPIISTSFTTTAATTDNVTVTGMTSTGHCALEPTNSGAAGGIASVFVSAKAANQITVTHTATSGWTFDVMCSPI